MFAPFGPAQGTVVLELVFVEVSVASEARGSRLTAWLLRAVVVGVLLALLTPALAAAQAVAEAPVDVVPPTGAPATPGGPLPGDDTALPVEDTATPPADPVLPEETPPVTEAPLDTPAPPPSETPSADVPAAPTTPPELAPSPGTVSPELPVAPDLPRSRADVVLAPVILTFADQPLKPAAIPALRVSDAPSRPRAVDAILGGPSTPVLLAPPPPASPIEAPPPAPRPEFTAATPFEPATPAQTAPNRREIGPGPPGVERDARSGDNPFDSLSALGGPAPAGSSLLAVLASYVIPGAGTLPVSSLMLFVQLAVILAAIYAPRAGIGERVLALGRLGPRHGYRTVLARPG